jgi:excisionase family DNA binding protein
MIDLAQPQTDRLFYSAGDVARLLSLSIHTIRRDTLNGKIRTTTYGRRRLIPASEVRRLTRVLDPGVDEK